MNYGDARMAELLAEDARASRKLIVRLIFGAFALGAAVAILFHLYR